MSSLASAVFVQRQLYTERPSCCKCVESCRILYLGMASILAYCSHAVSNAHTGASMLQFVEALCFVTLALLFLLSAAEKGPVGYV